MRIAYYTAGVTGWGHAVGGLAVANALARRGSGAEFVVMTSGTAPPGADEGLFHKLPPEGEETLSPDRFGESALYKAIIRYAPDLLIVELHWFMVHAFIKTLPCRKIFLCREVHPAFFSVELSGGRIEFRPEDYDLVLATEPFERPFPMEEINPFVLRNPGEILSRAEACRRLGLDPADSICLFAFKENPREELAARKTYSYLADECGYRMVYAEDYENRLFPAADYFNACDFLVAGAGFNAFWEARFFQKEGVFIPMPRRFENQYRRVAELSDHVFEENGADQLAGKIAGLG